MHSSPVYSFNFWDDRRPVSEGSFDFDHSEIFRFRGRGPRMILGCTHGTHRVWPADTAEIPPYVEKKTDQPIKHVLIEI